MSTTPGGYFGRYLRVDVTDGSSREVPLPEDVLRQTLGGSGLGVYLMLREQASDRDPLGADAPLGFVFSPLVGTPLTTSAKFAVVCRSPLTKRFNDSLASSGFALAGKRTGYDAIVIVGRAPELSLLMIDNDHVRLESATALRGQGCTATEADIRLRYGDEFATAVIGPAGENLVRFATISHDGRHAGRGGSGAVLGAKNLKAVVVRGDRHPQWHDTSTLVQVSRELSRKSFGPATAKYRELGTASNLLLFNRMHVLPTRNFQQSSFAEASQIAPETLSTGRDRSRASCRACTIGCEHIYGLRKLDVPKDDQSGRDAGSESRVAAAVEGATHVRLEYESLFALGSLCGIGDGDTILQAAHRCNELGMDTISTGGTIAFAMECVDRGLWPQTWLRFGDGAALLRMIEAIGTGGSEGESLKEGSRNLATRVGHGTLDFAPQVKGLEIPGYEPRTLQTMALGFAVNARGADHNRSSAYEVDFSADVDRRNGRPSAAALAIATEDKAAMMDSLIVCKFLRGVFQDFYQEAAQILTAVTGWTVTANELRQTASRIVSAKKLFNMRAGWQPEEDILPTRFLDEALPDDAARLSRSELNAMIHAYNLARNWTSDGWIPAELQQAMEIADW